MRSQPRRPVVTGRRSRVFEPPAPPPPWSRGDLPDGVLDGHPFASLDPALPLLPVRLETRYVFDADPPELRIRVYPHQAQVFQRAGRPVASGLRTGADPAAPTWEVTASGLVVDDGLAWMVDYDRTVAAGMAITVPLTGPATAALTGLDALLVVGVDPVSGAAALGRLLDAHARSGALSFVAQGTPTNETASLAGGWVPAPGDTGDDSDRFADALGLGGSGHWRSVAAGTGGEHARSQSMRTALYEAALGTLVRRLLPVGDLDALGGPALTALRRWFVRHVTGGAPLPTPRIGQQPYGVLPVRRAVATPDLATTAGQVERLVGLLIDVWRESLAGVPTLDPTGDNLEAAVATVLHPARLFARPVTDFADLNGFEALLTPQSAYELLLARITAAATGPYQQGATEVGLVYADQLAKAGGLDSIDTQLDLWDDVHDAVESQFTGDTRAAALEIVDAARALLNGFEHRQRHRPVDGIALLELDRAGGLSGADPAVREALDWLADAFDSVADAALFEGVHQLAAGNHARATAILDAVSLGERPPPELRGPLTPRGGTAIEHRVLVLLDPAAPPPGPGLGRRAARRRGAGAGGLGGVASAAG